MSREIEQNVRAAAAALAEAIEAAVAAGYRVDWPGSARGLSGIAISETGRMQQASEPVPVPTSDVVVDVAPPADEPAAENGLEAIGAVGGRRPKK